MTEAELAAIRARDAARTQGKWAWCGRDDDSLEPNVAYVAGPGEPSYLAISEADKAFIAGASEDVPALLAEVDRLRRVEAFLRPVADRVELCEQKVEEAERKLVQFDEEQGFMTAEIARLRAALGAACSGSDEDAYVNKCPEVYRALRGEA